MAGFLKSSDLGPHPHTYGTPHPHHGHPHGPLPPGMPMASLAPFGLPHGLEAVGFPQEYPENEENTTKVFAKFKNPKKIFANPEITYRILRSILRIPLKQFAKFKNLKNENTIKKRPAAQKWVLRVGVKCPKEGRDRRENDDQQA
uniref:Uncharacterized protein n=1 Tax=Phlebotomus papatasi TaxID=29031 RepID=A0A1B0D4S7_PHLPP